MPETTARSQYNVNVSALDVTLIGRVGKVQPKRVTPSGRSVMDISLVASQPYLDKQTNEWKSTDAWYKAEIWGDAADRLAENTPAKGDVVLVEYNSSKIRADVWQGQDGTQYKGIVVTADRIKVIARKVSGGSAPTGEPMVEVEPGTVATADVIPF